MKREKVVLQGQPIGRIRASWLLFKESFRFLQADSEIMFLPIITGIINLFLFGLLVGIFMVLAIGGVLPTLEEENSPVIYVFIFLFYVIGAFTLTLSQAGVAHIVYTRIRGGDATLGQGLKTAFAHSGSLLMWSIITSTVGLFLYMVAERSKLFGKILVWIIGAAWSVLTYFVVPAMIIDKKTAFQSISKSSQVFRDTWGETLVTNISIGLVFFLAHLLAIFSFVGLIILSAASGSSILMVVALILLILWFILAGLAQSSLNGVIKTLLYVYASENIVPENFNRELLEKMMSRKDGVPVQSPAAVPNTPATPVSQAPSSPAAPEGSSVPTEENKQQGYHE